MKVLLACIVAGVVGWYAAWSPPPADQSHAPARPLAMATPTVTIWRTHPRPEVLPLVAVPSAPAREADTDPDLLARGDALLERYAAAKQRAIARVAPQRERDLWDLDGQVHDTADKLATLPGWMRPLVKRRVVAAVKLEHQAQEDALGDEGAGELRAALVEALNEP